MRNAHLASPPLRSGGGGLASPQGASMTEGATCRPWNSPLRRGGFAFGSHPPTPWGDPLPRFAREQSLQ